MTQFGRRAATIALATLVFGSAPGRAQERFPSHTVKLIVPAAGGSTTDTLARIVAELVVYPEHMRKNLDSLGGLIHSQRVLLALTQKGVSREDAYAWVQRNAMPVWRGEGDFLTLLKADKDVSSALGDAEIEALFDLGYHLKHVDTIFARVFGEA